LAEREVWIDGDVNIAMTNADLIALRETLLRIGGDLLDASLSPTGAAMARDGSVALMNAPLDNQHAFEMLCDWLHGKACARELRASGILMDVHFSPPDGTGRVDALLCVLEHEQGEGFMVHQVYQRNPEGRVVFQQQYTEPVPEMKVFVGRALAAA
jgi:hypothetical protein